MSGFKSFGFGKGDEAVGRKTKKFKVEGGKTYRLSLAYWPGVLEGKPLDFNATPEFIGADRHFVQGVGFVINKGPEYTKLLGGDQPKFQAATVIVLWPTTKDGTLDKSRLADRDYEVMPWVFGADKYRSLASLHTETSLGEWDVKVKCPDGGTQYQKMEFLPAKQNFLRKISETPSMAEEYAAILADIRRIAENLKGELGKEYDLATLREKLGGTNATAAGSDPVAANEEIDGILDGMLGDDE